jgi:hypothetical protein
MNFERRDRRNYLRFAIKRAESKRVAHMHRNPGDHQYSHQVGQLVTRLAEELISLGGDLRNLDQKEGVND